MARQKVEYEHGSYGMYLRRGCRCDVCKAGAAKKRAEYRAPRPDGPKNYQVTYGSVRVRLDASPLIAFIRHNVHIDKVLRKRMDHWTRHGIELYHADRLAIQFGTHPYLLWGDEFYQGMEKETV